MSKEGKHPYVTHYSIKNEQTIWSRTIETEKEDQNELLGSNLSNNRNRVGTDMVVPVPVSGTYQGGSTEGGGLHP